MVEHYQFMRPDGSPDWTPGKERFVDMWGFARDRLRWHRGAGFQLKVRVPGGVWSEKRDLAEASDRLRAQLDDRPLNTIVDVRSMKDGVQLAFRRHQVSEDKGLRMIAEAASRKDTPYIFGVTDCSWLSKACVEDVTDGAVSLPHNAHYQRLSSAVIPITKAQLKPGDLVFIHEDDHVAVWLDWEGGGRVWDTEPHDTGAPPGWPTPRLGTGVQIRPAFGGYYCANQNAYGRIPQINGPVI